MNSLGSPTTLTTGLSFSSLPTGVVEDGILGILSIISWKELGQEGDLHTALYADALVPLKAGTKLAKPKILFTKLEDDRIEEMEEIANQRVKAADAKKVAGKGNGKEPAKSEGMGIAEEAKPAEKAGGAAKPEDEEKENLPTIEYEDFAKLDIRVGKVLLAEPVKKSKKLIRIEVDIGEEKPRQLVAGLSSYYAPEELVGKSVIVLANLKPAKLCGVKSNGMPPSPSSPSLRNTDLTLIPM